MPDWPDRSLFSGFFDRAWQSAQRHHQGIRYVLVPHSGRQEFPSALLPSPGLTVHSPVTYIEAGTEDSLGQVAHRQRLTLILLIRLSLTQSSGPEATLPGHLALHPTSVNIWPADWNTH